MVFQMTHKPLGDHSEFEFYEGNLAEVQLEVPEADLLVPMAS